MVHVEFGVSLPDSLSNIYIYGRKLLFVKIAQKVKSNYRHINAANKKKSRHTHQDFSCYAKFDFDCK